MSSSPQSAPNVDVDAPNSKIIAAGATLGVIGVLMVVGIVLFVLRLKKRKTGNAGVEGQIARSKSLRHTQVENRHPAARITPYGSPGGETPRFIHTPGANMLVATRRPDGGWDFVEPDSPFASRDDLSPLTPSYYPSRKEQRMHRDIVTNRMYEELDARGMPPPAYEPSEEGSHVSSDRL